MDILGFKIGREQAPAQQEAQLTYEEQEDRTTRFKQFLDDPITGPGWEKLANATSEEQFTYFAEEYAKVMAQDGITTTLEADFPGIREDFMNATTLTADATEVGTKVPATTAITDAMYLISRENNY